MAESSEKPSIGDFLSGLVQDTAKLNDYLDPKKQKKVLQDSGLTQSDQDLLAEGDPKKIMAEVHKEYGKKDVLFLPLAVQHVTAPQNILAPPDGE